MPSPDDERFEAYLKQFRPLSPEPLPAEELARSSRRAFIFGGGVAVAAVVLTVVLGMIALRSRPRQITGASTSGSEPPTAHLVATQPFTLRSANALLAAAPSFKAAVDDLAFHSQTITLPNGKQSTVAVLSEEKTKL